MKRLLLGSFGIGALPTLAEGDVSRLRIAYVPTAAGPDAEAQFWVKADREQLNRLGCITVTLDLARAEADVVRRTLNEVDAVFVTGGDAYHLLNESHRSGFIDLVPPRVRRGELIYVGTSSGAMLAAPDIAPPASDPETLYPDSTAALHLVDFSILPHDNLPKRRALNEKIVQRHPDLEFIALRDDQAVVVRGTSCEIVASPLLAQAPDA